MLLILAGVSIATLTGENGMIVKANQAKEASKKAELKERIQMAVMSAQANTTGKIEKTVLHDELAKIEGIGNLPETIENLPLTLTAGGYEFKITKDGEVKLKGEAETGKDDDKKDEDTKIDYGTKTPAEDTRTVIEQATAAKPESSTIDASTNENTGIVMIDSNQNEWVWIEVPSTVFTSATSSTNYNNIKADLIAYASDYRSSYTDEWYAKDGSTLVTSSTEGLTDTQKTLNNGCGLTYSEYNTNYEKMLSSIYTNKGFYIGRYEAGIKGSETNTSLARYSRTEITSSSPKAVNKKDMIPYNNVYCSDAQQLASKMSTGNKTSSLMYGIQWDLVCKFLEVNGTPQADIKEDSTSWGNYRNSSITLVRGKYNIAPNSSTSTWTPFNTNTDNYVTSSKTNSNISYYQLLTTGASEDTKKMNIYDFAGNASEWTLEHATTDTNSPCSNRGGFCSINGSSYPASNRIRSATTDSGYGVGLRSSLY